MTPLINRIAELLYPLSDFYASAGAEAPEIEPLDGAGMPQPHRRLLVHDDDMTPTLERFSGGPIHLRRIQWHERDDALFRQVVLESDEDDRPLEFGAIKIYLNRFEDEPRRLILAGRIPLGRIMEDFNIPHESRPNGFFRINSDALIDEAFGLEGVHPLYGRHNVIYNDRDEPLAEVVEILPPLAEAAGEGQRPGRDDSTATADRHRTAESGPRRWKQP